VPDFEMFVLASADQMLPIWMPVDGGANSIMGVDAQHSHVVPAHVPFLHGPTVGAKGKLDAVGGRPSNIAYAITLSGKLELAPPCGAVRAAISQIPEPHGAILAC